MTQATIYTTSSCPFCTSAKNLLKQQNIEFKEVSLDSDSDLRQKLSDENNGWRTVPMIFIDDKFVGGFDDLKKLHDSGELAKKD